VDVPSSARTIFRLCPKESGLNIKKNYQKTGAWGKSVQNSRERKHASKARENTLQKREITRFNSERSHASIARDNTLQKREITRSKSERSHASKARDHTLQKRGTTRFRFYFGILDYSLLPFSPQHQISTTTMKSSVYP